VPGSQPRPGSIIARSTAHRPETRRKRAHFAARTRRNFLSFQPLPLDRLADVLPSLVLKRSFRDFVLAHFDANDTAPMPILYRLAS
jgi:hypothetical protein